VRKQNTDDLTKLSKANYVLLSFNNSFKIIVLVNHHYVQLKE